MNLQNTSVEKSKLKKNYFDFIYSRSTLEHLVNVEKFFQSFIFVKNMKVFLTMKLILLVTM